MNHTVCRLLSLLSILSIMNACTPSKSLTVAFISPQSGSSSSLGVEGRQGFELALELLDWQGIDLTVEWYDDQGSPATNQSITVDALGKGIRHFIFHTTSAAGIPGVHRAGAEEALALSATVSAQELSGMDDYFFRVTTGNAIYGTLIMERLKSMDLTQPPRILMVGDITNKAYVSSVASAFTELPTLLPGASFDLLTYDSAADFSPAELARDAGELGVFDFIILCSNPINSARVAQNLRKQGSVAQFILAPWGVNTEYLTNGGNAVEGTLALSLIRLNYESEGYKTFARAYKERTGKDPSYFSQYGYEEAWVLLQILRQHDDWSPRALQESLRKGAQFDGLIRELRIDTFGDGESEPYFYRVVNGEFVLDQ